MTTTTKFADMGTIVRVLSFDDNLVTEKLKPAVYAVAFDMMSGFYLTKRGERLDVPQKVYGAVQCKVNKIIRSFEKSERSFGVLLTGDKGSGKTMTSSLAANKCIDEFNMPVIIVDDTFDGAGLVEFIEEIGECVLFMDEFGKKFNNDQGNQNALLGMFDGVNSSRRLVILTENESRMVNRYILERPGRVHYHFRHDKLDELTVREYCKDHEINDNVIDQICFRRETSFEFSFDVLQAIVKEYEMFGGEITEICDDLNIERPLDYSFTDMDIISVEDVTNGCYREVVRGKRPIPFPSGRTEAVVTIKGLVEVDHETSGIPMLTSVESSDNVCNDYVSLTVKTIMKKDGEVYTFNSKDDMGNDIIVKARMVESKASPF